MNTAIACTLYFNLQNQIKELVTLFVLLGATLSMGFMVPDDDEDKATKNFYRFSKKVVNKFVTELSFFYNPVEIEGLLSGNAFPATGLLADATRFIRHFSMQTTGFDLAHPVADSEENREKAQPIKYLAKMLPITKSMVTYMALLSTEFAEDYNVTIQENNIK